MERYKIDSLTLPRYKEDMENAYASVLAPFATAIPKEHSRDFDERISKEENRTAFQRDRDRIIHSKAFRRLMYKTQVFVNHEGDHFRTRLTHTLEVSQLSRGICKSLALNEDLAEAIALGHDLGHTPFGHAVERLLDEELKTREMGRFFHNEQSVRVVDFIETRSHEYYGLNLTTEVREGILKHNGDRSGIYKYLMPDEPCRSIEGQIVALVDTIAYICHDLQDSIESGIIWKAYSLNSDFKSSINEIWNLICEILNFTDKEKNDLNISPYSDTYFVDQLIHYFVVNITEYTAKRLYDEKITEIKDVYDACKQKKKLVELSPEVNKYFTRLKKLLYKSVYSINTIEIMDSKAQIVVKYLFNSFVNNPRLLPPQEFKKYMHVINDSNYQGVQNNEIHVICDYISCMTDRFAIEEYERIHNPKIKI